MQYDKKTKANREKQNWPYLLNTHKKEMQMLQAVPQTEKMPCVWQEVWKIW